MAPKRRQFFALVRGRDLVETEIYREPNPKNFNLERHEHTTGFLFALRDSRLATAMNSEAEATDDDRKQLHFPLPICLDGCCENSAKAPSIFFTISTTTKYCTTILAMTRRHLVIEAVAAEVVLATEALGIPLIPLQTRRAKRAGEGGIEADTTVGHLLHTLLLFVLAACHPEAREWP